MDCAFTSAAATPPQGPAAVDAYVAVARKHGLTPAQLALAHCNSRDFVTSTIIGSTTMPQLAENLAAFRFELTQASSACNVTVTMSLRADAVQPASEQCSEQCTERFCAVGAWGSTSTNGQ